MEQHYLNLSRHGRNWFQHILKNYENVRAWISILVRQPEPARNAVALLLDHPWTDLALTGVYNAENNGGINSLSLVGELSGTVIGIVMRYEEAHTEAMNLGLPPKGSLPLNAMIPEGVESVVRNLASAGYGFGKTATVPTEDHGTVKLYLGCLYAAQEDKPLGLVITLHWGSPNLVGQPLTRWWQQRLDEEARNSTDAGAGQLVSDTAEAAARQGVPAHKNPPGAWKQPVPDGSNVNYLERVPEAPQ